MLENAVMQRGGLHHGSLADPATGMAFTGNVGQPQVGIGNSEMRWYVYYLITIVIYHEFISSFE